MALTLSRTLITSVFNDHTKGIQLDTGTGTLIVQEHENGKSAEGPGRADGGRAWRARFRRGARRGRVLL